MRKNISIRLNAKGAEAGLVSVDKKKIFQAQGSGWLLTGYEDVFIRGAHELHGFLREQGHVFVNGIIGNIFVCAVI